jgi:hypothetical protein
MGRDQAARGITFGFGALKWRPRVRIGRRTAVCWLSFLALTRGTELTLFV